MQTAAAPTREIADFTVRGEPLPWSQALGLPLIAVLAVGLVSLAAYLLVNAGPHDTGYFFALIPAFILGAIATYLWLQRQQLKFHLTLVGDALTIRRGERETEFEVPTILEVTHDEQEALNNGVRLGTKRRVIVRTATETLKFQHIAPDEYRDVMGALLAHLEGEVAAALEQRTQSGESVEGKGWKLDSRGLHVPASGPGIPLSNFGAADIFEGKVQLWLRGERDPKVAISAKSPNARVLLALITKNLPEGSNTTDDSELGRLLFQHDTRTWGWVVTALGVASAASGLYLRVSALPRDYGLAYTLAVVGVLVSGIGFLMVRHRFRCYERGVVRESLFGNRSIPYEQLESFAYSATRQYVNGAYSGTTLTMTFTPKGGGKAIGLTRSVRGSDADLDRLRDTVSRFLAARLLEEITKGSGTVRWGNNAHLRTTDVTFRKQKMLGKGEWVTLTYPEASRASINQGVLSIFHANGSQAATVGCGEPNFYPGLIVFQRLIEARQ